MGLSDNVLAIRRDVQSMKRILNKIQEVQLETMDLIAELGEAQSSQDVTRIKNVSDLARKKNAALRKALKTVPLSIGGDQLIDTEFDNSGLVEEEVVMDPKKKSAAAPKGGKVSGAGGQVVIDELVANVTALSTTIDSAVQTITGIQGMIDTAVEAALANGATEEQLEPVTALSALLASKNQELAEAIAANTTPPA